MPRVSIVIRCYNEEEHIGRLLAGVAQQSLEDYEVIVVDSGSTDETLRIARHYPVRVVHISPEEFSFGRSLNRGCAATTGDILVFASAHVYPLYYDWLERLVAPFGDRRVALCYGGQRGNEVTKYSERQVFARWFPAKSNLNQAHPFCNNANAAIRRSLWERFPYDEQLTGLEDLDWAKRVIKAGYRIAYVADAVIAHVHDETLSGIFNRYRREAIAFKRIFPEERFTALDFARLFVTNAASDLYHAKGEGLLVGNVGSILTFRLAQFWGTYRGHNRRGPVTGNLKRRFYYPRGLARGASTEETGEGRRIDYSRSGQLVATSEARDAGGVS